MSTLKELLKDVPVEWKKLWEVTIWDKKFNSVQKGKQTKVISHKYLLAAELFELEDSKGNVFLLSTGEKSGFTTIEKAGDYLREGEIVSIPWGKSRPVIDVLKYYKGLYITADNRIATSIDTEVLLNKYLFYWLQTQADLIDSFYRGSGIKHPSMSDVLDMLIPIPPIKSQQEIVRVLDSLSEQNKVLTTALAKEIDQRKKQYAYYREELFRFEGKEVEWNELKSIFDIRRGKRLIKSELLPSGKYAVFQNSMTALGYYDEFNVKSDTAFIISAGSAGEIGYSNIDFWAADDVYYFEKSDNIRSKFLYYFLLNKKTHLSKQVRRSSVPRLSKTSFEKYSMPIPSLHEQERIVRLLDQFDETTKNIVAQLENEIELRNKQYEYYRNLLLRFPN